MIGLFLLILALILFFQKKITFSILIFLVFCLDGFQIMTSSVLGGKLSDYALIYVLVITVYNKIHIPNYFKKTIFSRYIVLFLILIFASSLYSYFYYGFTLYQIFQASREYYIILAYYFLVRLSPKQTHIIIRCLSTITLITSIIYILQILVVHHPLLPYENIDKIEVDEYTGLIRLYNSPILLYFFLYISFLYPNFYPNRIGIVRGIYLLALLCTLGRSGIVTVLFLLILGMFLCKKFKLNFKPVCFIILCFIPFGGTIYERLNSGGKTYNDFDVLFNGNLKDMKMVDFTKEGATLTYRLAWVYERYSYLEQKKDGELFFGLGLISGDQPKALQMYDFKLGLVNRNTGYPHQLGTPDIAWGNILARFGLLGIFFYTIFWSAIIKKLWDDRMYNSVVFCGMLYAASYIFTSITGSMISYTTFMVFPFLLFSLLQYKKDNINNEYIR